MSRVPDPPISAIAIFSGRTFFRGASYPKIVCVTVFPIDDVFFPLPISFRRVSPRRENGIFGDCSQIFEKTIKSARSPRRRLSNVSFTPISGTVEQFKITPQRKVSLTPKSFPSSLQCGCSGREVRGRGGQEAWPGDHHGLHLPGGRDGGLRGVGPPRSHDWNR